MMGVVVLPDWPLSGVRGLDRQDLGLPFSFYFGFCEFSLLVLTHIPHPFLCDKVEYAPSPQSQWR
jgi:hypothetical protein